MKIAIAALLVASAAAFAPAAPAFRTTALSAGGPAKSAEEDLELTRKVIMDAMGESSDDAEEEEEAKEE
jgi:hypothetical protein